jgi:hypothetical protein
MSGSVEREPHLLHTTTLRSLPRYQALGRRRLRRQVFRNERNSRVEAVFWARFEEREEGRVAQEADYLFDTSYDWAA